MTGLPTGVVTFMFTDVEGSTRLWEDAPAAMMDALNQHDAAIDDAVGSHNGISVKPRGEGDSRFVVFTSAVDALAAAADMQRNLAGIDWVTPRPLKVRASLHTGTADLQLGDYYGSAVNRAARIRAIAHGGQTIMSGATWELVQDSLPPGVRVRDMGVHRLKDLSRPERIYQLEVQGLATEFPPLASLDVVANNLPVQLTEFVGRRTELGEVEQLLGGTRLLTILAPGGTGKTRLAIQAAGDVADDYADGVYFVGLADLARSNDIVQAIAEAEGLALTSGEDLEGQLFAYLANKRQLLVLDNFEHLVDGAPTLAALLAAAPSVSAIVTSRSRLGLSGETVFTLGGLDATWTRPQEAMETSGVALFVDTARRARPGFTVTDDDLGALSVIMDKTAGMPLAIVLAASWADLLSIAEIAEEISRSIDFLESTASDVPDRHRSVRAVFEYTWRLLDEKERAIFSALSVFRGGFGRRAAEAVTGASIRDLSSLVGKSLIESNPDTGRYAIHELLRQYAAAELATDEGKDLDVREGHAAFFVDVAAKAFGMLSLSDEPAMLAAIEGDLENVRAAWRHLAATGNAPGMRSMAGVLWTVYEIRGWYPAALALFGDAAEALAGSERDADAAGTTALVRALGSWFLVLLGRVQEARDDAEAAVETLRGSDDPEALWMSLIPLALTVAYSGEDWSGIADEGIQVARDLDGPFWEAVFKNWRGGAALMAGDFETSRARLLEGLAVYESLGEHYWMSLNLQHQAQLANAESRHEDAGSLFARSVERARQIGAMRVLQLSLTGLGDAGFATERYDEAESAFIDGLITSEQMGLTREMLSLLLKIGKVRAATGRTREAVEYFSTVMAEPASAQQALFESATIAESAAAEMSLAEPLLDADVFTAARDAGRFRTLEVAFKELTTDRE